MFERDEARKSRDIAVSELLQAQKHIKDLELDLACKSKEAEDAIREHGRIAADYEKYLADWHAKNGVLQKLLLALTTKGWTHMGLLEQKLREHRFPCGDWDEILGYIDELQSPKV